MIWSTLNVKTRPSGLITDWKPGFTPYTVPDETEKDVKCLNDVRRSPRSQPHPCVWASNVSTQNEIFKKSMRFDLLSLKCRRSLACITAVWNARSTPSEETFTTHCIPVILLARYSAGVTSWTEYPLPWPNKSSLTRGILKTAAIVATRGHEGRIPNKRTLVFHHHCTAVYKCHSFFSQALPPQIRNWCFFGCHGDQGNASSSRER